MPELPEVETVVKALNRSLTGRVVERAVHIGKLRLPFDAAAITRRLAGRSVRGVRRRAKYILIDFEGDTCDTLMAHLGMTGYFHMEPADALLHQHDRLVFSLRGGEELRFSDARRFGFVQLVELPCQDGMPVELHALGPEPLEKRFTGNTLQEKAEGRKCPVKVFIMDQEVVVGVGNIYASEALHAAGVDPRRAASNLTGEEWGRVVAEIKAVLRRAIRRGGSTIRNYRGVDGSEGRFQRSLRIYGKTGGECPDCGETVQVIRLGGRSTFFCPKCQK